jgi:hypothetical protein
LGPKLPFPPEIGKTFRNAIISVSPNDEFHPRKSVVRACIHRGREVFTPKRGWVRTYYNLPKRPEEESISGIPYPEEQEE